MRKCQLHVKKIEIENPDKIMEIGLEWKFNPKTGALSIRIKETPQVSFASGYKNMNIAYRDFNDWM